ncbi:ThiF family adenylyltransferase, partial [Georgenia sp. 10Sc9-8]|nr:ThiF family adenylyltransferase [Georgenia halotolerans]
MSLPPLVPPGSPLRRDQVERYSRHLLLEQLGETGQRRLLAARVLVVGAGGLGSPILQYLAAAGVGTIGVVDSDVVDSTNLQRQVIHAHDDVGRPKVDSAAEHVRALNPDVAVERHHLHLDATNARTVIAGYGLVLDGTDNFPTRYLVNDVCADLGLPLVWGSILRFDAQVSVFWSRPPAPESGVTLRDLFPVPPPPGTTPSCGQAGVLGAMCGQVGSLMAAEAVKLIAGAGRPLLGRVAVLDVLGARWSEVPLRPRPAGTAPTTRAELGYDPQGAPVTAAAAPCSVPDDA